MQIPCPCVCACVRVCVRVPPLYAHRGEVEANGEGSLLAFFSLSSDLNPFGEEESRRVGYSGRDDPGSKPEWQGRQTAAQGFGELRSQRRGRKSDRKRKGGGGERQSRRQGSD